MNDEFQLKKRTRTRRTYEDVQREARAVEARQEEEKQKTMQIDTTGRRPTKDPTKYALAG